MLIPAVVPPVTLARIIMALDPACLGPAVGAAHSVPGAMEAEPAAFARLRRPSGNPGDRGSETKRNQSLHDNLLSRHPATRLRMRMFREIPFTIPPRLAHPITCGDRQSFARGPQSPIADRRSPH